MSKKKTSFYFFLEHYIEEQKRNGRHISKRLACEECSPLWKNMPEEQKQIFIDLAKAFKTESEYHQQSSISKSAGCAGGSRPTSETAYLTSRIRDVRALRTNYFYLIHCNYYCRTEESVYVPAELALVEFNLEQGITRKFHTLIDPGRIPLGYAFETRRIASEVHGLPLPPYEEGEKNFSAIFDKIMSFMKQSVEREGGIAPFFTIENNILPTKNMLTQLGDMENFDETGFNIYSVNHLLFWLKNKATEYCGVESGFMVLSNAICEIEKDVYRYCTGISCTLHSSDNDHYHNCSLAITQRLAYTICDHCCKHLQITLIRGKHVHENFCKRNISRKPISSKMSDRTSDWPEFYGTSKASTYASSTLDPDDDVASVSTFDCGSSVAAGSISTRMKKVSLYKEYGGSKRNKTYFDDDSDSNYEHEDDDEDLDYVLPTARGRGAPIDTE